MQGIRESIAAKRDSSRLSGISRRTNPPIARNKLRISSLPAGAGIYRLILSPNSLARGWAAMKFLKVPKLRVWHFLGIVAAIAAYLAVSRYREEVYNPYRLALRQVRYGNIEARRAGVLGIWTEMRPETFESLLQASNDADGVVRARAADGLAYALNSLRNDDPQGSRETMLPLWEKPFLGAIERLLADRDPAVRLQAATQLRRLNESVESARNVLVATARDGQGADRWQAIYVLMRSNAGDPEARAADPEIGEEFRSPRATACIAPAAILGRRSRDFSGGPRLPVPRSQRRRSGNAEGYCGSGPVFRRQGPPARARIGAGVGRSLGRGRNTGGSRPGEDGHRCGIGLARDEEACRPTAGTSSRPRRTRYRRNRGARFANSASNSYPI